MVIIIIDQVTKHLVRTTPSLQNWDVIPGWLSFHYTQNPGMALGMDWASTPVISMIAILAVTGIIVYVIRSIDNANIGYLLCMGLVLGGAFGNIADRLIMGYIGNYGGLLEGHVIDFIHFTLRVDGYPVFPYIFNVADISISTAIISLLLFHQRILPIEESEQIEDQESHKESSLKEQLASESPMSSGISTIETENSDIPVPSDTSTIDTNQAEKESDEISNSDANPDSPTDPEEPTERDKQI